MDPKAAIAFINDPDSHSSDRLDSVNGLAHWILKGGGIPYNAPYLDILDCHDEAMYPIRETIAAINCALANADVSGLRSSF